MSTGRKALKCPEQFLGYRLGRRTRRRATRRSL